MGWNHQLENNSQMDPSLLMVQTSGKLTSWGKGSLSHYLQGFKNIPGGDRRISEPSTVWFFQERTSFVPQNMELYD